MVQVLSLPPDAALDAIDGTGFDQWLFNGQREAAPVPDRVCLLCGAAEVTSSEIERAKTGDRQSSTCKPWCPNPYTLGLLG